MEFKGAAKNPLAIIALFISFMYGSASLILGTSIDKLDEISRRALVAFLILFPMVIFGSFLYLVIKHHRKLYAPGDYRSDEGFLAGLPTVSEDKKQIEEQGAEDATELPSDAPKAKKNASDPIVTSAGRNSPAASTTVTRPQSRLAETLAADLFHERLGGVLKRNVQFSSRDNRKFIFDFAIEEGSHLYLGEVKLTRSTSVRTALHGALGKFLAFENARISTDRQINRIAVIVVEDRVEFGGSAVNISRRFREIRQEGMASDVVVEAYTMTQLINAVSGESSETGSAS